MRMALRVLLVGLGLCVGPAQASRFTIAGWGGWAGVRLTEVEENYRDRYQDAQGFPNFSFDMFGDGVTENRLGFGAGVELGVRVLPRLTAVGRIGVVLPGETELEIKSEDLSGWLIGGPRDPEILSTMHVVMVPALLGVSFETAAADLVRFRFAAFAGMVAARAREDHSVYETTSVDTNGDFVGDTDVVIEDWQWSGRYEGRAPAGEVLLGVLIPVTPRTSIAVEGTYRLARISRMTLTRALDEDGDGVAERPAGDPYRDHKGRPLSFDLSGAEFRFGVRFAL